ncbi:MAG TPA: SIMPL domain-containing protein [Nevskiaceae bacterium]|nr:SIMPL domain-containing protein [Nevskiaceae bacterium]
MDPTLRSSLALGGLLALGLALLGQQLAEAAIRFKEYERVVTVKGLSEREVPADVAVWPILYTRADADLGALYRQLEADSTAIQTFLAGRGFEPGEITVAPPAVTDKLAQSYGGGENIQLRYSASQTITVYTGKIEAVRGSQIALAELGKRGIAFGGNDYQARAEYLFTGLNALKPPMIEEATRQAREVAEKFAADSNSRLGKIKSANQGQFTVADRDSNTPHIKNVRVVSTVEYYLSD